MQRALPPNTTSWRSWVGGRCPTPGCSGSKEAVGPVGAARRNLLRAEGPPAPWAEGGVGPVRWLGSARPGGLQGAGWGWPFKGWPGWQGAHVTFCSRKQRSGSGSFHGSGGGGWGKGPPGTSAGEGQPGRHRRAPCPERRGSRLGPGAGPWGCTACSVPCWGGWPHGGGRAGPCAQALSPAPEHSSSPHAQHGPKWEQLEPHRARATSRPHATRSLHPPHWTGGETEAQS